MGGFALKRALGLENSGVFASAPNRKDAALFDVSKDLFILCLARTSYEDVYGSVAPVMALLFWAYVSSLIALLGAEICSEYERMKHNVERGVLRHRRRERRAAEGAGSNGARDVLRQAVSRCIV